MKETNFKNDTYSLVVGCYEGEVSSDPIGQPIDAISYSISNDDYDIFEDFYEKSAEHFDLIIQEVDDRSFTLYTGCVLHMTENYDSPDSTVIIFTYKKEKDLTRYFNIKFFLEETQQ